VRRGQPKFISAARRAPGFPYHFGDLVVIIDNGVAGVIFGWLFRRLGLIAAMVAHFSADVVLHVIGPMIG
jgi:hypothetical protein